MLITSKARSRGHSLCRLALDWVDARKAPFRAHSCMGLDRRSRVVVVARHSDRPGSDRREVGAGSPRVADRDAAGHSGRRVGHRSSHVVEECGDGSHRGVGCTRAVDHDGRSSSRPLVVDRRSRGHDSQESESGSAHEDVGCRFEAVIKR